jgi:hypothetical protein
MPFGFTLSLRVRRALRIAAVASPPLLLTLWSAIPALHPEPKTITGNVSRADVCLITCAPVVAIGDQRLLCRADFLGAPHACRERHMVGGEATVRYSSFPSLASFVGLSPTTGVLLRMERGGERTFRKSLSAHAWSALYGGWVFHAVYWPIMGLIIWLWPKSWLSRRVTWEDLKEPEPLKAPPQKPPV